MKALCILTFGLLFFLAIGIPAQAQMMQMPAAQPPDIAAQLKQLQERIEKLEKDVAALRGAMPMGITPMGPMMGMMPAQPGQPQMPMMMCPMMMRMMMPGMQPPAQMPMMPGMQAPPGR